MTFAVCTVPGPAHPSATVNSVLSRRSELSWAFRAKKSRSPNGSLPESPAPNVRHDDGRSDHLASWAAVCPGNNASAGKRISGTTRDGNKWQRRTLCHAALAVTRKKDCLRSHMCPCWLKTYEPHFCCTWRA